MAITIQNLRIVPYSQKNELKCVWGDTLTLTFTIPHVAGESYVCGIDNDRVVYPPSRPVCAYTNVFTRDGDDVTFSLPLNTSKFRSYVSSIRKPMPVWLQVCRVGLDGKCETIVLDDILAIPSVLDATNTVCEGDPLKQLLDGKMDKPAAAGTEGQVLTMDADGHYAWADLPHIPEDPVQSDWDESDSSNLSYIKNKPAISKVGHTGEYDDLLDKPDLKPVATSGSYNDLTDKPHIPVDPVQADYDESDSTALSYIKHKPDLSVYSLVTETGNSISMSIDADYDLVVSLLDKAGNTLSTQDIDLPIESMIVDASYSAGVLTLTLQNGNTVDVDISDIVSGLVPDSRKVNGHALDEDVTISYNDLTDKPVIPEQAQSDWDESDSAAVDFIRNKPATDTRDYLCFTALAPSTVAMATYNDAATTYKPLVAYSLDKVNWNILINQGTPVSPVSLSTGDKMWIRGNLTDGGFSKSNTDYTRFVLTGKVKVSGNIMSLIDPQCNLLVLPESTSSNTNYTFASLFFNNPALVDASELYLPALEVGYGSYYSMFRSTGITKAPKLPATTLDTYAYGGMFRDCTSLSEAPELPATTVVADSYNALFRGCANLKRIKYPLSYFTACASWMQDVGITGVFECLSSLAVSTRGASTVPAGWTVVRTDQPQSDWDESDSTISTYIRNKPELPAFDYLCIRPQQPTGTIGIDSTNSSIPNYDIEYSFDGQKWHQYEWTTTTGPKISVSKAYAPVFFRGDNPNGFGNIKFVNSYTGVCMMSGCIDSLIAKDGIGDGKSNINANVVFDGLFRGFYLENTPRLSNMYRVSYNSTFRDCTTLIYANIVIPYVQGSSMYDNMFNGCTNLSFVESRINTTSSGNTLYWSNNWLNGAGTSVPSSRKPRIIWHQVRGETAQGVPSGWQVLYADIPSDLMPTSDGTDGQVLTKSQSGSAWNNPGTSKVVSSSESTYTISATTASTAVLTVSSALTLTAPASASTDIAYAEVVIDLAVGATVTAGSNLTLVDTPTAGKRNVCVVRWQGGTARLYVVDTMDLPA